MKLPKWPMLVLAVLCIAPWTAAEAEQCDDILIRRAGFMVSRKAQLAATQLVTRDSFDQLSTGITGQMRLVGRSLSSFGNYDALDEWRRREAGKDFYQYGADSARAAILASTSEDAFSTQWAACQLEEAGKKPPPSLKGWVQKLEADSATVRLVLSALPDTPIPAIDIEPAASVTAGAPTLSSAPGRVIVERLVTVQRLPQSDTLLKAKGGNITISVVVPGLNAGSSVFLPPPQRIESPSKVVRETATFFLTADSATDVAKCFEPALSGETFDLNTIRVTANPADAGYWSINDQAANKICLTAKSTRLSFIKQCIRQPIGGSTCFDVPNPSKAPYVVVLRVDKVRSLTDANNAAQKLESCASGEQSAKIVEIPPRSNRGPRVDDYNREAGVPLGSPWEFSFISYCIKQAGLESRLPISAYGPQLWANAVKAGLAIAAPDFQKAGVLKVGDIYFSGSSKSVGPAGIVVAVSPAGRSFTGIEGNTNDDGGAEGLGVFRKTRTLDEIKIGIVRFPAL